MIKMQDLATLESRQPIKLQHFIIRHLAFLNIPPLGPERLNPGGIPQAWKGLPRHSSLPAPIMLHEHGNAEEGA